MGEFYVKKTLAALLLLFGFATAYGIQGDTEWVKFTAPNELFTVMIPHEPKLEVDPNSTLEKSTHQRFNDFEEGHGFVIEYFKDLSIADPDKYLDKTSGEIVETLQGP